MLVCSDRARPCARPPHPQYSLCRSQPLQQAEDGEAAAVLFITCLTRNTGEDAVSGGEMEFACCGEKEA